MPFPRRHHTPHTCPIRPSSVPLLAFAAHSETFTKKKDSYGNTGFAAGVAPIWFKAEEAVEWITKAYNFTLDKAKEISQQQSFKYLVAGALAGIVSRTVVSPFEVVATLNMCSVGQSTNTITELKSLFRHEGFRGFFKGNGANCMKVAPTKGIQFVTFEAIKRLIFNMRKIRTDLTPEQKIAPLSPAERLAAGGIAGTVAATVCYPLEVAKTLLTAHPETYKGVFATVARVARERGVRGLYRGLGPTLIAMFPYVGIEFMVYEQLKLWYSRKNQDKELSVMSMMLIGAVAGTLAQTSCHPLDVVRKRLQLQGIGGRPLIYKSMIDAAGGIFKNEGFRALYRGLQPTYYSVLPSAAVSYAVYEHAKKFLHANSFK